MSERHDYEWLDGKYVPVPDRWPEALSNLAAQYGAWVPSHDEDVWGRYDDSGNLTAARMTGKQVRERHGGNEMELCMVGQWGRIKSHLVPDATPIFPPCVAMKRPPPPAQTGEKP